MSNPIYLLYASTEKHSINSKLDALTLLAVCRDTLYTCYCTLTAVVICLHFALSIAIFSSRHFFLWHSPSIISAVFILSEQPFRHMAVWEEKTPSPVAEMTVTQSFAYCLPFKSFLSTECLFCPALSVYVPAAFSDFSSTLFPLG